MKVATELIAHVVFGAWLDTDYLCKKTSGQNPIQILFQQPTPTPDTNAEIIDSNSAAIEALSANVSRNKSKIKEILATSAKNSERLRENKEKIYKRRQNILENRKKIEAFKAKSA